MVDEVNNSGEKSNYTGEKPFSRQNYKFRSLFGISADVTELQSHPKSIRNCLQVPLLSRKSNI
jgi:hypothetical protein